jgi:hypothetical protein
VRFAYGTTVRSTVQIAIDFGRTELTDRNNEREREREEPQEKGDNRHKYPYSLMICQRLSRHQEIVSMGREKLGCSEKQGGVHESGVDFERS